MKLNLPSAVTTGLSLAAGVLATLNQFVFHIGSSWYSAVTVALVFLSGLGISPLFGQAFESKFKSIFHLGPSFSLIVSSAIAAVTIGVSTFHINGTVKSIVVVALTVLAGLGFAPTTTNVITPPKPSPTPAPVPAA